MRRMRAMVKVSIDVINPRPDSIYAVLKRKLGREPTNNELAAEVRRILSEA
jgi:DNA-directed RNA polymerase specialized sigma subunit